MTRSASPFSGVLWGLTGVTAFSFTVIFTRIAVEQLDPLFVGSGRAVVAAAVAALALVVTRARRPTLRQCARLAVVAGGVVLGFPLLTSFALTTTDASHGAVVIALLPAATAVAVVLRTGERPPVAFWIFAGLGAAAALGFAALKNADRFTFHPADLLLVGAVVAAAIGYAEGGLLARELGSWQTISWALIVASPVTLVLTVTATSTRPLSADPFHWLAFAYVALVSMFLGFVAWYRGLAIGPMTRISQLQLVQPVLSLVWAALILGETLSAPTLVGAVAVIVTAAAAVVTRGRPLPRTG